MKFTSASEFLTYLKKEEARGMLVMSSEPDLEFQKITDDQLEKYNLEIPNGKDPYDIIVDEIFDEIKILASVERLEGRIVAGCLDHDELNAQIVKSDDGYFAILINKGLIILLNKFLKLVGAAGDPSSVIYCSRGDPSGFSSSDYIKMTGEILAHYAESGVPRGPRLKLSLESDAARFVVTNLRWVELFIVAHEVGHYVNGDLNDVAKFSRRRGVVDASVFRNENDHRCEYMADRFAFETVARITADSTPDFPAAGLLFGPVTMTFNFLRGISDKESYTHPASSVRLLAITRDFFGEKAAEIMDESFSDLSLVEKLPSVIGNLTVKQLVDLCLNAENYAYFTRDLDRRPQANLTKA